MTSERLYVIPSESAYDTIVNDWDPTDGKRSLLCEENFLVLQVSATPYNLLTKQSRIPIVCLVGNVMSSCLCPFEVFSV